ncbi:MAG: hypothetical protein AAF250_16530 [Pseudomonadota bacterium]
MPRIGRRPNGGIAEVIDQLDRAARSLLGDEVIALLVRGSVAHGGVRDALDLDLVLVTREREEDDELWHGLPRTGPLPVEWSVLPLRQLCEAPSQARLRFALAHGGVTWSGSDVVGALPTRCWGRTSSCTSEGYEVDRAPCGSTGMHRSRNAAQSAAG